MTPALNIGRKQRTREPEGEERDKKTERKKVM